MNLASSYQIHSLIMSLDRTILEEPIMATLRVFLSDEEMHRLEELSKREDLTVEQMVRLGINGFISQSDDFFRAAARRVMEKNAELYQRLS
jgi:predicted DNA-binding protein